MLEYLMKYYLGYFLYARHHHQLSNQTDQKITFQILSRLL